MNFNMRQKMKICEVLNRKTNQRDEKYAYRIGKSCYLPEYIKEDEPISWLYENGEKDPNLKLFNRLKYLGSKFENPELSKEK